MADGRRDAMKISPVVILLGVPLVIFIVVTAAAIVLFNMKIVTPPIGWLIFGGGFAAPSDSSSGLLGPTNELPVDLPPDPNLLGGGLVFLFQFFWCSRLLFERQRERCRLLTSVRRITMRIVSFSILIFYPQHSNRLPCHQFWR